MKRLTAWLCTLFIRDAERVEDPLVRRAYGTLASIVGIVLNLLLFAGKFAVGTLFGAVSVLADAMNNLSDALSQMISLISFRIAAKPADRGHPFGHARMEYVASTVVAMLILMILSFALLCAAFLIFPYELSEIAAQMRGGDAVTLLAATNG
jgi:cation diffusion facilitator family transporter